jgi:hypothetical protein
MSLPEIFTENLSLEFNSKVLALKNLLHGLQLGVAQNKYFIIDELEFSLELFIVQERMLVSNKAKQAKCENFICGVLKQSAFNGIKITSTSQDWNPYLEAYSDFKANSFHDFDLTIHRFLPDGLNVYKLFEMNAMDRK